MPEEEITIDETLDGAGPDIAENEVPVEGVDAGGDQDVPPLSEDDGEEDDITIDNILDAIFELPAEVQQEIHERLMESLNPEKWPDFSDEEFVENKKAEMPWVFL